VQSTYFHLHIIHWPPRRASFVYHIRRCGSYPGAKRPGYRVTSSQGQGFGASRCGRGDSGKEKERKKKRTRTAHSFFIRQGGAGGGGVWTGIRIRLISAKPSITGRGAS